MKEILNNQRREQLPSFTPFYNHVVLRLPIEVYPSKLVPNKKMFDEYVVKELTGKLLDEFEVVAVAEDIKFCKVGDKVLLGNHARPQPVEEKIPGTDEEDEKFNIVIFLYLRESDLLAVKNG